MNNPESTACDGPAGISSNFNSSISGTAFPPAVLIAATWNKELAYQRGAQVGKECNELQVTGWYGPAMNTHRSAFAGRNFEYYSEDSTIAYFAGPSHAVDSGLFTDSDAVRWKPPSCTIVSISSSVS